VPTCATAWPRFTNMAGTDRRRGLRTPLHTDLSQDFAQIGAELRSLYSVGYYSTNRRHDGSFRKIVVETKTPGLTVRVKSGYYAK